MLGCIVCSCIVETLPIMQHYRRKVSEIPKIHTRNISDLHSSTSTIYNVHEPIVQNKIWDLTKQIRWYALGIVITYIVTLSIFPGYISENVKSNLLRDWYPIILMTIYNITDLAGKCFTSFYLLNSIGKVSWACIARLLFYPLFTACLHGPRWLQTEIPVVLLTSFLGLTNGYLTSTLMILAPKSVAASASETAGILMVLFLGIGMVGGSFLGWLWII
ncbi:Equilibrative nucleotide transporter like [Thalictrum thalictroides]|uniref:Equilibrative nucleotide transporter like n=1 Tax=Thalictrum thalictroides TaxID=46969 RepID=A0A7J6WHV3_THATH|nr:Equilibrative nucleotide transporter like [Thalictrum thalictroides]